MNRILQTLSLLLFFSAMSFGSESISVKFRGCIHNITLLTKYSDSVIATHFNPQFVVVIDILSVNPALPQFTKGKSVALAIHSPTQLFGQFADTAIGHTFDFAVIRTVGNKQTSYSALTAIPVNP